VYALTLPVVYDVRQLTMARLGKLSKSTALSWLSQTTTQFEQVWELPESTFHNRWCVAGHCHCGNARYTNHLQEQALGQLNAVFVFLRVLYNTDTEHDWDPRLSEFRGGIMSGLLDLRMFLNKACGLGF